VGEVIVVGHVFAMSLRRGGQLGTDHH
jgi:hypothetical protein